MNALARLSDPETSHEAAASVENVRESQQRVYRIILDLGGATDERLQQVAKRIGLDRKSVV